MDYRTQKELLGETRLSALFSPLLANRWLWLEAVIIPIIGIGLCWLVSPDDPFFINKGEFPWTWFAPVLVALRYGVMAGIASTGIMLIGYFFLRPPDVDFPKLYFLAGLIMVMIAGEYSTTWRTRLRRVGELNAYLTERFTRIMNQLNVLRLSHDQLEHDLITQPATLRDALHEMRLLIFNLHPPVLEQEGLVAALQARLDSVEARAAIRTELTFDGEEQLPFPAKEALYFVAQEALNNTLRHAEARHVTVRLAFGDAATRMEIADDGRGFDVDTTAHNRGLGLHGMQERIEQLGGKLAIRSAPGTGTRITVEIGQ